MQGYAVAALGGPRWQALSQTMRFVGADLTGADFRLQVRLRPNTPGAALIDLTTVSTAAAEGVRLISVATIDGKPVSMIGIRINETTMEGMPFTGELGDSSVFAWDMQITPAGGLKQKWVGGDFIVEGAVTGADSAPYTQTYGTGSSRSVAPAGTQTFQVGETIISVTLAGGEGPPGKASGPLGAGSVGSSEISDNSTEKAAIRSKIGAGSASDVTAASNAAAAASTAAAAASAATPYASTAAKNIDMTMRPVMRVNRAVEQAILAGSISIVVVGDSIQEPAGISYANSVAENVQRLMQTRFPWVTVNLVNLSIPGRAMSDLANGSYTAPGSFTLSAPTGTNSSYWPGGSVSGKSWRDHVKDATPDMVILALGENDGTDELPFSINYQTFYEYSQTWTKKPWFVLVSSLLPEGSATDRQGKQAVADFMKYKAIEQGFGLIDANSIYRLLRDGRRRDLIPAIEETDFVGFGDTSKWVSTGPTISGTVVSGSGRIERQVITRDVDLVDYFTLTSANAVWLHSFRVRPGGVGGYSVQTSFADQGDGQGGAIRLYYRGSLVALARFPAKANGASLRIRVKSWGPLIRIWHDNALLVSYSSAQGLYAGVFDVGTAAGSGSHAQFRVSYAPEYQAAASFFSATYLLNDQLHHPTAEGALQVYIPAAKQFVDEFARLIERPVTALSSDSADVTYPTAGNQVLTTPTLTFTLASARTISVRIRFGYKNTNTGDGTLTLRLDGTGVDAIFLTPTTGTNNRQLSYTVEVPMAAGTHTLDLVEGAPTGATAGITSTGAGNLRSLAASVQIA